MWVGGGSLPLLSLLCLSCLLCLLPGCGGGGGVFSKHSSVVQIEQNDYKVIGVSRDGMVGKKIAGGGKYAPVPSREEAFSTNIQAKHKHTRGRLHWDTIKHCMRSHRAEQKKHVHTVQYCFLWSSHLAWVYWLPTRGIYNCTR